MLMKLTQGLVAFFRNFGTKLEDFKFTTKVENNPLARLKGMNEFFALWMKPIHNHDSSIANPTLS